MKPSNHFRSLCAASALVLALPLVGAGCKKEAPGGPGAMAGKGGMPGGNMPGMAGKGGMPGGNMPGMAGKGGMPGGGGPGMMPGGGPGMMPGGGGPGMMPGGGPGMMAGGAGMAAAGGAGGAAPGAALAEEGKISFRAMKFVSPPRERLVKQPNGTTARHLQFHYRAQGDPEALLPFLNTSSGAGIEEGSIWFVSLPRQVTLGKKTPGEWENLFCTYVVADSAAIARASEALQARLLQARRKLYPRRIYTVDVLIGEALPQTARAHTNDAMAAGISDNYTRMTTYLDMTREALRNRRVDLARVYLAAAKAALADLSVENGHAADALWIYRGG